MGSFFFGPWDYEEFFIGCLKISNAGRGAFFFGDVSADVRLRSAMSNSRRLMSDR